MNGLKPATIHLDNIYADVDNHAVVVVVDEDQQSLAIGKKGQNVRLASRLCGWDIDIKTREEFEAEGFGNGSADAGASSLELTGEAPEDEETSEATDDGAPYASDLDPAPPGTSPDKDSDVDPIGGSDAESKAAQAGAEN